VIRDFGSEAIIMPIAESAHAQRKMAKTAVNAFRLLKLPSLTGNRVAESNGVVTIVAGS